MHQIPEPLRERICNYLQTRIDAAHSENADDVSAEILLEDINLALQECRCPSCATKRCREFRAGLEFEVTGTVTYHTEQKEAP